MIKGVNKMSNKIAKLLELPKLVKADNPALSVARVLLKCSDVIYWMIRHHLMKQEYFQFHFTTKSKHEKLMYVTDWEVINVLAHKFNSPESCAILEDKTRFNEYFSEYIRRDFALINHANRDTFLEFSKKHGSFFVKPLNLSGGTGIIKMEIEGNNGSDIYDQLIASYKQFCVEEILVQHYDMALLNPDTVNTIRVITMRDQSGHISIPMANIRIGRTGQCVDNFCAGGMTAAIDLKNGCVSSLAFDKENKEYRIHPDSHVQILGFQIPEWEEVKHTAIAASKKLPKARYIGWDITILEDGRVAIIEGNHRPEARIHQIALGRGLRSIYRKNLGDF